MEISIINVVATNKNSYILCYTKKFNNFQTIKNVYIPNNNPGK